MRELQLKKSFFAVKNTDTESSGRGFALLAIMFILGAAAGAFIGAFSSGENIFNITPGSVPVFSDYIRLLWENLRFHLAAVFLATTFLGLLLLPLLSAARGYFIGCTASAILCSYPKAGIALSFTALGIPLLVGLPCFFLLLSDSFAYSTRILSAARRLPELGRPPRLMKHLFACAFAVSIWSIGQLFLSPRIIAALI